MKKIFTLAAIALFTITSCSDNDSDSTTNPDDNTGGPLVTSMVETVDGENNVYTYTYDGNKITKIQDQQGFVCNYTFTNGLLAKEENYYDGELSEYIIYSYNADSKLSQTISAELYDTDWDATKTLYAYNSNGTVSTTVYSGDQTTQATLKGSGMVTYANGNITQYAFLATGSTVPVVKTMTYNDKNDPFKNVFANDVISLAYLEGGSNSMLSINDPDSGFTATYSFLYNAGNYPTTETENWDGDITTYTYTYSN
jgi:hypothetical protein